MTKADLAQGMQHLAPAGTGDAPSFPECMRAFEAESGRYRARFAHTAAELDAVLRLRFQVFNLELDEGLDTSFTTQRDRDRYDAVCHHLVVEELDSGGVVGTYRMQTRAIADLAGGFYSDEEFDLSLLGEEFLGGAVELGRACIAAPHRNGRVLFLLWRGLAAYMLANRKRYFFGCCSLTSQDPAEGLRVLRHLETHGFLHESFRTAPRPGYVCEAGPVDAGGRVVIPKLMRLYLEYGAKICGPPAIDRLFKTIDYLVAFDLEAMAPEVRRMFVA